VPSVAHLMYPEESGLVNKNDDPPVSLSVSGRDSICKLLSGIIFKGLGS